MKIEIVIAQRGWVFVGEVTDQDNKIIISNARNIRRWGTTKGLGEIAANGPTENTILDSVATVTLHPLTVIARIECNGTNWKL